MRVYFSPEDVKEERIEIQNLLRLEDLEKLRSEGFVCVRLQWNVFLISILSLAWKQISE